MPKLNLTQAAAEKLPTPPATVVYWDTNLTGFGIRVSPKGRKTFIAQYRVKGGPEMVETIGTMQIIPSVAEARQRARHSMLKAKEGINPVIERRHHEAAAKATAAARALTFGKLAERYLDAHVTINCKPRGAAEIARLLGRAARFFGDKPVHEITKGDVLELVHQTPSQSGSAGGRAEASNLLIVVRRAFRWAVDHELLATDPSATVKKPLIKTADRDRVLADGEMVQFWHGCESLGYPFGPLFQLLLLTGQRLREVGELPWSEIDPDNRVWHLPKERAKNSKAHDIHLSDEAMAIINRLPRLVPLPGKPDYLFSISGDRPVMGYWKVKARLAETMGVTDWTLHDLRRTATTIMARLGVMPHVADCVLNHTSGTIHGVAAVYNRFEYRDDRKAALDALGRFVEALVNPEVARDNIVALRG